MKKIYSILVLVLIASLIFASCNVQDETNKENETKTIVNNDDIMDRGPVKGGVLKLFSTKPDTLNPLLTHNVYVKDFSNLIFEGLFEAGKDQKAIPVLVKKWDVSDDGLTWTFYLNENVFWHDNIPFSAEDVKFTFDTIGNMTLQSVYYNNISNITAYSVVNKNTFKIILAKPNSFTPEMLTFPILAKHCFVGEDMDSTSKNQKPVGTGPYKFKSYNSKSNIKMTFNDNWWQAKSNKEYEGLPYISDIEVKIYSDGKEAINAFQAREIDVAFIPFSATDRYTGRMDLVLRKYTGSNYDFITFNLSKTTLKDKNIRQAIAYAVDRQEIINEVLPGGAVISELPVIPDTWFYNSNIVSYSPSISKAQTLMTKSGRGYVTTYLTMIVNDDNELRYKVALKIKDQLARIGIQLQVTKLPWSDMLNRIKSKQYDLALMGWKVSSVPDTSFAYSSHEIATGRNVAGYSNPDVDKYLKDILAENDASRKKAMFINLKNIITDEMPYLGLYFYDEGVIYNKKLRGDINPYIWNRYNQITKWYIPR